MAVTVTGVATGAVTVGAFVATGVITGAVGFAAIGVTIVAATGVTEAGDSITKGATGASRMF